MSFSFSTLSKPLFQAVSEIGYDQPTEIQSKAIPILLEAQTDFVGQAQTGTGKTAAFCLPLLERIDPDKNEIQALILSPTRELANQIYVEIQKFARYLSINATTVYGGVGYRDQIDGLRRAHIVIATPGRAIDLLDRSKLKISKCKTLIIDEADEMLKMGFLDDVEKLIGNVSKSAKKWMFSATMPGPIVNLMNEKLDSPQIVRIEKGSLSNQNISQSFCVLQRKDFTKALTAILLTEEDFFGIVFCETKEETKILGEKLLRLGKRVAALHGDLNQNQRDSAMERFKNKKVDILVCTDVAARGLDVSQVTHVINMGLPRKPDSYVHRIGRTGRAGQMGKAISFIAPNESRNLRTIERLINQKLHHFEIPSPTKSKVKTIEKTLHKMDQIKTAIKEKGSDFKVDDCFSEFENYFQDLSKEEISKLVFTYLFNSELRSIDESISSLKASACKPPRDNFKDNNRPSSNNNRGGLKRRPFGRRNARHAR